jgi:hypothetical protein
MWIMAFLKGQNKNDENTMNGFLPLKLPVGISIKMMGIGNKFELNLGINSIGYWIKNWIGITNLINCFLFRETRKYGIEIRRERVV